MSLSERMNKARMARTSPSATCVPVDGLSEFKVAISNALFERLGQRLFETQNEERSARHGGRRDHGRSWTAEEAPLTDDERHRLRLGDRS